MSVASQPVVVTSRVIDDCRAFAEGVPTPSAGAVVLMRGVAVVV
jgi:hypothetical protein